MKRLIYTMAAAAMLALALPSCTDTHDDLPYVDPNIQHQQDQQQQEEQQQSGTTSLGSISQPISVSSAMKLTASSDTSYVSGYIVGYIYGTKIATGSVFASSDTISQAANVLIAESADVTDYAQCIPVQLPSGKLRDAVNLKDNKANIDKPVVIGGLLQTYFGVLGLKNAFYVKIDNQEINTAVATVVDNTSPQPVVTEIDETFAEGMGNFRHKTTAADAKFDVWSFSDKYGMVATGYVDKTNYASEGWLISPPVDLTGKSSAFLTFEHASNYFADDNPVSKACQVLASTDSTTWEPIEIQTWPTSFTFVNSGVIPLAKYAGEPTLRIAFKYTSTAEKAGTWEIKNVKLTTEEPEIITPEHAAEPAGDGTRENPYNVSYIQQNEISADQAVWVKATIIGYVSGTSQVTFSTDKAVNTNIAIADSDTVKTVFNTTSVKLPAGDYRDNLSIADNNAANLGKTILMYGKIGAYYGFDHAIKELIYAEIDDKTAGTDPDAPVSGPIQPTPDPEPDPEPNPDPEPEPTPTVGDGTYANPYTCANLLAMELATSSTGTGYVTGYIVGSVSGNSISESNAVFGTEGASTSNVLIADSPNETDWSKCVTVKANAAVKAQIYLSNNADALGKKVALYGTIKKYLGTSGINQATFCELYSADGTTTEYGTKPE